MKDSFISPRLRVTLIVFAFAFALPCSAAPTDIGGGKIDIVFSQDETDAQRTLILDWITNAARAVTEYYGHSPVAHLVIRLHAVDGDEIGSGQTHGTHAGAVINISVGSSTTATHFKRDWMMTHEMVHLAFPSVPDRHHWKRTNTPWLSDHLCWGSVDGRYTHDLLPMPYTFAAAKTTAANIREAMDFLEVPICVENVSSYAEFHASEMTEWEFLSEVIERADCGILLDVNNIYVSSQNHNFDPYEYLNNVPHHRVGQIHIAGHSKFEKYILDTHDHPVLDPVWKMYAHAIKLVGKTATLLEWDDRIPSFDEVHNEALKANRFVEKQLETAAA